MTSRQRLMAIIEGRPADRPAVKLWGARPDSAMLHPAYQPVHDLAVERTDLVLQAGSPFDLHWGAERSSIVESEEQPTESAEWVDVVTRVHTPDGVLRSVHRRSTVGMPGYDMEHLLKEPDDVGRLLSVPYRPLPFSADRFRAAEALVGNRGITIFSLDHAAYGLHRAIGSERFALWSIDCRDVLLGAVRILAARIMEHARLALDAGVGPVFGWVGPELIIPPLMSPRDFEEFVYDFDEPLSRLIHERGGRLWVHCHSDVAPVLERFIDMGVDILNPLEPPPIGALTLAQAFDRVGDRMALEGNIETHALMTAPESEIRSQVRTALSAGRDRRLVLCQSSGYMEWPRPTERYIANLLAYLDEAARCVEG